MKPMYSHCDEHFAIAALILEGGSETAVISAGGSCLTATIQMQINIPLHFRENMLNQQGPSFKHHNKQLG